jgi:competence ComEA-like helix-hairpin-helix protein
MAFSFFSGKKDKNPPEAAAPVAKAPPTPPKIQNPPGVPTGSPTVPAVKPPQPAGLIPATGKQTSAATTQPMVMPRAAGAGLKPARPGVAQSARSTQRIVLPGAPGGKTTATKSVSMANATGRVNLPIGMILRCLPPEVLAADLSEFEASGAAATEIGLPMNLILSQLPSGKIEIPLSELVPHFPAGYLQPTQSITSYLPNLINLPLMDVVMRIPPDLMQLRSDQKDVDAAVINMADPFTEEILREQAEAARRLQAQAQAQASVVDESPAPPAEEIPAAGPKTIAPPPRPKSPPASPAATSPPPPMPPLPSSAGAPASPSTSARTISPSGSGRLPTPTRATTAIPTRAPAALTSPIGAPASTLSAPKRQTASVPTPPVPRQTASVPAPPVPPVPRQTGALPVSTLPRQTAFPPQPFRPPVAPPAAPVIPSEPPAPPVAVAPEPVAEEAAPEPAVAPAPSSGGSDDLQRLAALAMAELGEDKEAEPVVDSESATVALPAAEMPAPEPAPEPEPEAAPEPVAEEAALAPSAEEADSLLLTPEPEPEPEPEPVAVAPPLPPPPVLVEAPMVDLPPVAALEPPVEIKAVAPPVPVAEPVAEPEPESLLVSEPAPSPEPAPAPSAEPVSASAPAEAAAAPAGVAFNLNTCTAEDLVKNIPGCFPELAESIVRHRAKIGSFGRLEDLLDVPGITKAAYTNLTGEAPPDNRIPLSLNELLGFPANQEISLKDVTDRIACWPDVTGCILSQSSGLPLVGSVPEGLNMEAIVAFVPRMFEDLNKSFLEITGKETDGLMIPAPGNSFHIFRNRDLYLVILNRMPQMPERHMKVARFVLAALSIRRN